MSFFTLLLKLNHHSFKNNKICSYVINRHIYHSICLALGTIRQHINTASGALACIKRKQTASVEIYQRERALDPQHPFVLRELI